MRHIEWVSLTDAQRGQLVAIWLLGADHNGVIPASPSIIKKLCHLDTEPDLKLFMEHGFIDDGVIMSSIERQHDSPETEKSREETEKRQRKIAPSAQFELPDWIDKVQWDLWLQTRKGKKMIPAQMQAQVDKLQKWRDAGLDHCKALADAAAAGWQGLFEPKNDHQSNNVQQARLTVAQQIQGVKNGTNRSIKDITPGRTIEGDGKSVSETSLRLREPDAS